MGKKAETDAGTDEGVSGRRTGDRRESDMPIDFPDRRKGERRSGKDRRGRPRIVAE